MKKFFIRWFINSIALMLVASLIPGITVSDWRSLFVAALVWGLLNAFLRPLILMVTLPITILSLGIFTFFINAFLFYLVSKLVPGFIVGGFWCAFWGALLMSILNLFLNRIAGASSTTFKVRFGVHPPPPASSPRRGKVVDAEVVEEKKKIKKELPENSMDVNVTDRSNEM
ncbi:MAG: phage holin family protein [Endomicrobiales bacterium]|jgi:putative membrane protein